jgi:thiamine biosynthesis lipoprotein
LNFLNKQISDRKNCKLFGLAVALYCLVFLWACQDKQESNTQLFVFGTIVEIKLWGATQEQSDRAFTELQQMFNHMHRNWHAWEPGMLTDINLAFAQGESANADTDIIEMIHRSQEIEKSSGGRFNPAIGELISLWGFHTSVYPVIGPPPTQTRIDEILNHQPSSLDIQIDGLQLRSENPYVKLDFGGIAKGYAVDLAIKRIRKLGIANAIVNAGGDLRAIGRHGDRPWNVAVKNPGGGIIGTVEVRDDEALFTSGNYERFREDQLKRYPHILDPRSGWPVKDVASVTVIASDGIVADAAATALVVAGLNGWSEVARALDLNQVLIVDESGKVYLTEEMERRMQFSGDVERNVVKVNTSH